MRRFDSDFTKNFFESTKKRKPNFENILKVLKKDKPERFTLFEFFMNNEVYKKLCGEDNVADDNAITLRIKAFAAAGYDYCTVSLSDFRFPSNTSSHGKMSRSFTEGAVITDWESFEKYKWPEPEDFDTKSFSNLKDILPEGMKLICPGPGGVLENVIELMGYENLCYMLADDPGLVQAVFDNVGERIVRYYKMALEYDSVGAIISNDDWGFKTQTMLSIEDMRKYVFKWHKKITETAHNANRPVILHSCGYALDIYDDIINDMKYDGKHSYEDNIRPVEDEYAALNSRIAVMGGIDLDFICRSSPEDIYKRSCRMLEIADRGGYALGSGNSIPTYVPFDNYIAMISAAVI